MAYSIKNFYRATKRNDFLITGFQQRFLSARSQLSFIAKRPTLTKRTKSSFTRWNSGLSLNNGTPQYSSIVKFHHLAEHTLINNAVFITNNGTRNFAKGTNEVPSLVNHLNNIRDVYDNARFEKEKKRLKQKGVMKDIKIKIPEGVIYSKL